MSILSRLVKVQTKITEVRDRFIQTDIIESSVPTGTAPISITSTTKVANLNADFLDGNNSTYYASKTAVDSADLAMQTDITNLQTRTTKVLTATVSGTTLSLDEI